MQVVMFSIPSVKLTFQNFVLFQRIPVKIKRYLFSFVGNFIVIMYIVSEVSLFEYFIYV